jgi:tRNA(fMet)-specific endonuclease VapC
MTLKFLLDTNVFSEPLRNNSNQTVEKLLERHHNSIALASVVWHEIMFGCLLLPVSKKRVSIEKYLEDAEYPIIPYSTEAAVWHALERARLSALGRTPPFADGQIAAIAAVSNLTLVTFNVRDFSQFDGLKIVDWRS